MRNRLTTTILLAGFAAGSVLAQDATQQQADFNALTAITKETDPAKKLSMLDDWTQKSLETTYAAQRNYAYFATYSQISASVMGGTPTPDQLAAAEKADHTLLDKIDVFFAPGMKVQGATDAQWQLAKDTVILTAHKSLAAIALFQKNYPAAEQEDAKLLEINPNDAVTSMNLGGAIRLGGNPARRPEYLYHYARAVSITGPTPLDPALKKQTDTYLTQSYKGYHGDTSGLDDLKAMAAKSPMPPADFKIKSVVDLSKEDAAKQEEFDKSHPQIISWRTVKGALTTPEGETYFKSGMKDAQFPKTTGKVVAQPNDRELTVSIDDATPETAAKAEATLKFTDAVIKGTVAPGIEVSFVGEPTAFTKDPFMLTFNVEKAGMEGVELGPAASKKAPVRKKTKTK